MKSFMISGKSQITDYDFIETRDISDILSTAFYNEEFARSIQGHLQTIYNNQDISFSLKAMENYKLLASIKRGNYTYNLGMEGSGLRTVLNLLLRIEMLPEYSTVFLNEPECHVEVGRQGEMVDELVAQSIRKSPSS